MDDKELLNKLDQVIKKLDNLNKELTELSEWNANNNDKIKELIKKTGGNKK